jgi:hypothetical protein
MGFTHSAILDFAVFYSPPVPGTHHIADCSRDNHHTMMTTTTEHHHSNLRPDYRSGRNSTRWQAVF